MNILVDTDFILEIFLNRNRLKKKAEKVWNYFYSGQANGYINEVGLERIYLYIQELGDVDIAEETIWLIKSVFQTLPVNREILQEAASMECQDFESALEVVCAKKNNIDAILTQKHQDFKDTDYNIWSFEELLERQVLEQQYKDSDSDYINRKTILGTNDSIDNNIKDRNTQNKSSSSSKIFDDFQKENKQSSQERNQLNLSQFKAKWSRSKCNVPFLTKFLLFCAGANTSFIYKPEYESDRSKYASIGATILITTIMATLSGGYALLTVFQSYTTSAVFGSFWGVTIFNLDRSLVSGITKGKNSKNFIGQTIALGIRLSLATLIGLTIAKPLELKFFESKIDEQIAKETIFKEKELRDSTAEAVEIESLNNERQDLMKEKDKIEKQWLAWETIANEEMQGINGSRFADAGFVYQQKKEKANHLKLKLKDLEASIEDKNFNIHRLKARQDEIVHKIQRDSQSSIIERLITLNQLAKQDNTIFWSSLIISLMLIALEVCPLMMKIFLPYGAYDFRKQIEQETSIYLQIQEEIEKCREKAINNRFQRDIFLRKLIPNNQKREAVQKDLMLIEKDVKFRQKALNIAKESQIETLRKIGNQYLIKNQGENRERATIYLESKFQELEAKLDNVFNEFSRSIEYQTLKIEATNNPILKQDREQALEKNILSFLSLREQTLKNFEAIISQS